VATPFRAIRGRRVRVWSAGRWSWFAVALALTGAWVAAARAQAPTASLPAVTAAFLLNFVKFIEWPAEVLAADTPLTICVGDGGVAEALTRALAARPPGGRTIAVERVTLSTVPRECGVVYLAGLDARQTGALLTSIGARSVLSVSNTEAFTRRGGIIHLFVEDGTMRFAVNQKAADRARLRVSARLLNLARIVRE
jgi:hypothetical protein